MLYLTAEEILRIHFQVIKDYGGVDGVRDLGRVGSVEFAPQQTAWQKEQYVTVYEKAAVYLRNIIADHPFVDGNKRTAITVCGIFLLRNGYRLTATPDELEDYTVKVATEHPDVPTIAAWIEGHARHA